jgi:ribosomal protein L37E
MQCQRCGVKQGQYPRWLCRACDVAAGTYVPVASTPAVCQRCGRPTRERLCAACGPAGAVPRAGPEAPPRRERVIGGRVYVVVWDGSRR